MVVIEYSSRQRWRCIYATFTGIISLWVWVFLRFSLAGLSLTTPAWLDFVFAALYAYGLGRNIQGAKSVEWFRAKYLVDHSVITRIWPDGRRESIRWSELERISGRLSSPGSSGPKGYKVIRNLSTLFHFAGDGVHLWAKDVSMSISCIAMISVYFHPLIGRIADAGPKDNLLKQAVSLYLQNQSFGKPTSLSSWCWYLLFLSPSLTLISISGYLWFNGAMPTWESLMVAAIGFVSVLPACLLAVRFKRINVAPKV